MKVQLQHDLPDQELVHECLRRNDAAWESLLRRYKRMICSVAVRFGFGVEETHDVFQAVCLNLLQDLGSLRQVSSLRHWILTIAIRECHDHLRRKYEERRHDPEEKAFDMPDQHADTLNIYLSAEREQAVLELIEQLPERCRALLQMLFFKDTVPSYEDIAAAVGVSKDSIGPIRQRCLLKLRSQLQRRGF